MKWLGTVIMPMGQVQRPEDFAERASASHVLELAESIKALGGAPANLTVVEAETGRIVAGRDRYVAQVLAGVESAEFRVCKGEPWELELLEIDENLRRRQDNRDELIRRRVDVVERQFREEWVPQEKSAPETADKPSRVSRGPEKTPRGKAREVVAKEIGRSPEAVRKAEERDKKKHTPAPQPELPVEDPHIRARGQVSHSLGKVDSLLQQAQRELTQLEHTIQASAPAGFLERPDIGELRRQVKQLAQLVRSVTPAGDCLYCKGYPHVRKDCPTCQATGYGTDSERKSAPAELQDEGPKASIYVNGKLKRLAELT